jgi:hypothetical protein
MRRMTASALLLASALVSGTLAGCKTGTDNNSFEPDINKLVITVLGQAGTLDQSYPATDATNGFAGATAEVNDGFNRFEASFFKTDGTREANVTPGDFEIRVSSSIGGQQLPPGISFERTGPFTGTITGLQEDQTVTLFFSVYHLSQSHNDFGPYPLNFHRKVSAPPGGGGGGGNL